MMICLLACLLVEAAVCQVCFSRGFSLLFLRCSHGYRQRRGICGCSCFLLLLLAVSWFLDVRDRTSVGHLVFFWEVGLPERRGACGALA